MARNPFDSVTGALDTQPIVVNPAAHIPDVSRGPYDDPLCKVGPVVLIAASEDPDWSFAAVGGKRTDRTLLRRGDELAGHTVAYIGWDRVWLTKDQARCQMVLGEKKNLPPPPKPPPKRSGRRGRRGVVVPPEIASKIQKVSDTEFRVDRSAIDMILEKQSDLMRSVRILPDKVGGKVAGFRIQRIAKGSLLDKLGLKNRDRIRSINGLALTDPQKALEAYARLRSADQLSLALQRGGKDMTIDIRIQ